MNDHAPLNFLAIGYDSAIMQVIERLLNSHEGWKGTIALTREDGLARLGAATYNAVLLCAGVSASDEATIREAAAAYQPATKIIRHYGGGSGLLENEIRTALDHNNL